MKVLRKVLRALLTILVTVIGLLLLLVAFSVAPIDRTPAQRDTSYALMMKRLDSLKTLRFPKPEKGFSVGYSKVNFTPSFRTATAGYGPRMGKLFSSVHDSVYVSTLVIENGSSKVAIVSADLLIIPPTVIKVLKDKLPGIGFSLDNTYLGATHTHNSIGNWGEGATRFIYGAYNDSVVNLIANAIITSIRQASQNVLPSKLLRGTTPVAEAVSNRLIDNGPEDPLLRTIEVHRSDSSKLLLMSYTAHATCLFSKDLALSRDYPGKLVDEMESNGYTFSMFMAGAVGSHGSAAPDMGNSCIDWTAQKISNKYLHSKNELHEISDSTLWMIRVPLALAQPQVKLTENLKARSWLFNFAFGEYPAYLTALRLGDVVMLGTPCDYSGEFDASLDELAKNEGMNLIITSFNGGYIGYVTPSKYYDIQHSETQLMNWYPPGNGEYITECLSKLTTILSGKR